MAVAIRRDLLRMHAQLHLRLVHAAVGTYPYHAEKASLPENRLLLITADSGRDDSFIRDLATGARLPMRRGHGYFIPCGHEIDQHLTGDLHFVSFKFNLDLFYGFDVMAKFPECRVIDSPALVAEAQQLIRRQDAPAALCRINELIYRLCAKWLTEKPVVLQQELRYYAEYAALLDFVEKQGDAQLTVGMLAEMSHMRQDVFSRKFTRELGLSPKAFISRALARKASLLLGGPGMTVKEAADRLNFSSEYYFSRFFKHHTGLSPLEFQRNHGVR
jgi:AraC-like DNA-binding protein